MISQVIDFVTERYHKKTRQTGEPALQHPLRVMKRLQDLELPQKVLIVALLHDVCEDSDLCYENIIDDFGYEIGMMVYFLSKKDKSCFSATEEGKMLRLKHYLKKLDFARKHYPEVLLVKMSDQIDNLLTLDAFSADKQKEQLDEVKEHFIPVYDQAKLEVPHGLRAVFHTLYKQLEEALVAGYQKLGLSGAAA